MPIFFVLFGKLISFSFLGDYMQHHGMVNILNLFQGGNHSLYIIAICHKTVIQAHGLEQVTLRLAVGIPQLLKALIHAAMNLGNALVIVVEEDNEIGLHLTGSIQPFQSLAATHGAVADNGNDIFLVALQIPGLGQARSQADGSGGMPHVEHIVLTFLRVGVA